MNAMTNPWKITLCYAWTHFCHTTRFDHIFVFTPLVGIIGITRYRIHSINNTVMGKDVSLYKVMFQIGL